MHLSNLKVSVLLLAIVGFGVSAMAGAPAGSTANAAANSAHHATALPAALRPALYQAMAKDAGPAYAIRKDGCATLSKEKLTACFTDSGAHFTLLAGQAEGAASPLALHLVAWGRPSAEQGKSGKLTAVNAVKPTITGNQASYAHGDLTEWWRVLPMGFEQGFTIAKRPAGHGKLMLALATSRQDAGAPSIRHSRDSENSVENSLAWGKLRYGKLVVTDAKGKIIPATLKSKGDRILIAVNDTHAAYPITVDPLVWLEQKVTSVFGDGTGEEFGTSVALDGSTAAIGAAWLDIYGNSSGAIYVFNKSKGSWSQTLAVFDNAPDDHFGSSIALLGDTMLVGASGATINGNSGQGAVYVFTKSGGGWTQTQELVASDGAAEANFGISVSLDGTTALVGAFHATESGNAEQGAAYVFTSSGGSWSQSQKLTASNGAAYDSFGNSVALSGATALVGAFEAVPDNGFGYSQGTVYVFNQSSGSWSQTQELTADRSGDDNIDNYWFGWSVALSDTTAVIGAPHEISTDTFIPGVVYVFTESDGSWSQAQKIPASGFHLFGYSVALSGITVLIGAPSVANNIDDRRLGAVYIFTESAGTWSKTQQINASDEWEEGRFGSVVALSGSTALVGSPHAYDVFFDVGAAYFYSESELGLSVSAPRMVGRGQQYVSQTIATNNENSASPAVTARIKVPKATSFISATATQGSCDEASGVVTCDFGQINGNAGTATANVTLKATGDEGATIQNVAGVAKATPSLTASAPTVIEKSNSPPVAEDGMLTTAENTPANGTFEATDPDGDPLTFLIVDKPKHGTVSQEVQGSNAYLYTPNKNYSGSDSFTFKANDGQADSNVATINITVKAPPPPPPPPPSGGGGGGATGPFGLGLLALAGLLAFLRRRR